jgi:hypothetical protein
MKGRIVVLGMCLLLFAACQDSRAVIFDNQSECGTIRVVLTHTGTGEEKTEQVPIGEKREIVVEPNVFYTYSVDFGTAGRTPDDSRCVAVEEGRVRVPAGAAQTFRLTSQKMTATPTP